MKRTKLLLAAGVMAAVFATSASAAWYAKFDGVDGSVKSASWGRGNTLWLTTEEDPVEAGLLLPAVQAAREAARRNTSPARARAFDEFEFTDTNANKTFMLHGATATPAGGNRVQINFRCKDWVDLSTGAEGSDCPGARAAYGKDGKKGGNVETTWKVEEGES